MAIIKVNNTSEESSVNFLTNQSSILYTLDTNKITVNGVNVFVNKPKVGDIMCVTRYTDEGGALLPADQQQVKWIDGLSINPKQLSQKYEAVGICVAINGNKAMVRYREERSIRWAAAHRWVLPKLLPYIDNTSHNFTINLNGTDHPNPFEYSYNSFPTGNEVEEDFIRQLNDWLSANAIEYSAEFHVSNGNATRIVNNIFSSHAASQTFSISDFSTTITATEFIDNLVENVNWYYKNNGFKTNYYGGCCRAMYYDYINANQVAPTGPMTSINSVPYSSATWPLSVLPAKKYDFDNNYNCKILRDNFANYDEYLESWMVKFPCGAGGQITKFPSGKENTYKFANIMFANNITGKTETEPLYTAANWAASIDVNAPKLGKGNWWLPSVAEMAQMLRDITYGTSFWKTNPDIVNRVLKKLTSITNSGWSMLSAYQNRWTSSGYDQGYMYSYSSDYGFLFSNGFATGLNVAPITLYEF